jgi:hypothetical protein
MFDDENDNVLENEDEPIDGSPGSIEDSGSGLDDDDSGSQEGKLTWKEKRRQRGRDLVAEAKRDKYEAEQRALRADQRAVELERRLNQIEGRLGSDQKKQEEDDVDKALMENYNARVRLSREINARAANNETLTDAESEQYLRETKKLDDEQYELRSRKFDRPAQQQPQQPQESPQIQALRYKYADVVTNQRATAWATGQMQSTIAEREHPPTQQEAMEILDDVMNRTRQRFRIGEHSKSTDASKNRFSGVGSDYSTTGGRRGKAPVNLTDTEKAMARQFYSDTEMSEEEMYKRFAKEVRG